MPDHDHGRNEPGEWAEVHQLKRIAEGIEKIEKHLACICSALQPPPATDFRLVQIKGDWQNMITGVQVGGSAAFQIFLVPANAAALQSGPVATSDDTNVSITPNSSDPTNPFMIVCTVATGDTNTSFNLKVDGVNSAGTAITHTFVIPILQAPPPVALDFDLDQLAASPLK